MHALHAIPLIPLAMSLFPSLSAISAPAPKQPNAGELEQAIERLSVVGSVLYVAAHPDDENTKLLAYLANEKLVRAAYVSVTRGDGGQNLIGSEQGPLLGLIRTQELLAARRVDGAEQFFTRARDFGYSKTAEETLAIWGHDQVLADLVWVIRRFQPDVIITRFPASGVETHGHHTASAILAGEAFRAAADPKFHPEQLKDQGPWQAKRLLWNRFSFGAPPSEDLSRFLKVDIGPYNPQLGLSYGEMAAQSRSMHKSQGFGAAPSRGESLEYFLPIDGEPPKEGLFDGIDLTWHRVRGAEKVAELLRRARIELKASSPPSILPVLLEARRALEPLATPYKAQKMIELDEAMLACSGLYAEASAADFSVVPGGELKVTALAVNRSNAPWKLKEILIGPTELPNPTRIEVQKALAQNQPHTVEHTVVVPAKEPYSNPYWLEEAPEKGLFKVRDPRSIGLPENSPPLRSTFVFEYDGKKVSIVRPVSFKWTDPVAGERWRPLEVIPPLMIHPRTQVLMFPRAAAAPDKAPRELRVLLKSGAARAQGTLIPKAPPGWTVTPASIPFDLAAKGTEEEVTLQVVAPAGPPASGTLELTAELEGKKMMQGVLRIEHPHIPIQTLFPKADVKLVRLELARTRTRIGYIPGAGDEVPAALRQVGYEVTILGDDFLQTQPLDRFEAIVVGVRAYNTNPRLPYHHQKLMDWIARGGTLVTQYNTNNRLSKTPQQIGPYPFQISQDRVTDEDAPVVFELPDHPILRAPNRITPADFEGWTQERGLYFAGSWSNEYAVPLSMHDPSETPKKGGLLVARHGKGAFIYTGLAFFRQLPAGVPGAYRLFTNLICHGR